MLVRFIQISNERAFTVHQDIAGGSEPGIRFYTMVAVSVAIASFGLMMNSTAVVIGAMLVAPLMTPIFGIALALVRGDAHLLGHALRAEIAGIVVAVALSAFIGFLMPELEATPEMLSRTSPNLLDLLVAVFSGFAGAYALVDEKISPALPGVAIATAIVPPLANSGLCISLGAYYGALGSFLLFFANFLSILLIASVVFLASGMARNFRSMTQQDLLRRFGLAAVGFLIVLAFLSHELYKMVQNRRLKSSISAVLTEEFSHVPASELQKVLHQKTKGNVYVLAHIHAPNDISPLRVEAIEQALENELETPVDLFVRSTLSKDISSTGTINQVITESLDGFFLGQTADPKVTVIKVAEQTIREFLAERLGLYVEEINLLSGPEHLIILATVFGVRKLTAGEIQELEGEIQRRTGDDTLGFVIRHINTDLYDRDGHAYYEWTTFKTLTPAQEALFKKIKVFLEQEFTNSAYFLTNTDISIQEDMYHVFVELAGLQVFSQDELLTLQQKMTTIAERPVKVYVRSKPEVVVSEDGYSSFEAFRDRSLQQTETIHQHEIDLMLEESL